MRPFEVKATLRALGMKADRRLGQHFLVDERIARRQVEFAALRKNETVLEIGPGLGVLTRLLAAKAGRVVAIEKDHRFCRYLEEKLPRVEVIEGDALRVVLPPFDVVVSNLPYQISSPVTFRLLESRFDRAVLMFQKEFAERMIAGVGGSGYSRLSVQVYYRAAAEMVEGVPRTAFFPQPEVDSAIISLRPRGPPFKVRDEAIFINLVDRLFQHRRKTISNGLSISWREFGTSREGVKAAAEGTGFAGRRVEELSPEEIGRLADVLADSAH